MFLSDEELVKLTGRKQKALQIAALRRMGVAFRVNDAGRPVVTRAAVEGGKSGQATKPKAEWMPAVLAG